MHEGVKFSCEQCDFKYKWKHLLQNHVLSVHKRVTFHCEDCDYKATKKSKHQQHVNLYMKE